MSYLSTSAVVIHYEEALYQVYGPLPLPLPFTAQNYDGAVDCRPTEIAVAAVQMYTQATAISND